jgi:MFS family permease
MGVVVQVTLQNLLGRALGPIFVGAISDMYGLKTELIAVSFVPILSVTLHLIATSLYTKDLAKSSSIEVKA